MRYRITHHYTMRSEFVRFINKNKSKLEKYDESFSSEVMEIFGSGLDLLILCYLNNKIISITDTNYFLINNNYLLILKKIAKFNSNQIIEMANKILLSDEINNFKDLIMFHVKNNITKLTFKHKLLIEYLSGILNLKKELDEHEYTGININPFEIDTNQYLKLEEKSFNEKEFLSKKDVLNTSDSMVIDYAIKKLTRKNLIKKIQSLLKNKVLYIKEADLIKIFKLFINNKDVLSTILSKDKSIINGLIKHGYVHCLNLFNNKNYVDDLVYEFFTEKTINFIKSDESYYNFMYENCIYVKELFEELVVWDFILVSDKLTDWVVKKGITLPYDYISKLCDNSTVIQNLNLSQGNTWVKRYYYRQKKKTLNLIKKTNESDKNDIDKITYSNMLKLKLPLTENFICRFINFIDDQTIIKFYSKSGDDEKIISYIVYTSRYKLLDKFFELGIYDKNTYVKNFSRMLKLIFGSKLNFHPVKIYSIYKNSLKYGVKYDNFLIKILISNGKNTFIKKIMESNPNIKINIKTIKGLIEKSFYNGQIDLIPTIKLLDKNITGIENLFDQKINDSLVNCSKVVTLENLLYIKSKNKNFCLNYDNLQLILMYRCNYREATKIIEYIFEENKSNNFPNTIFKLSNKVIKKIILESKFFDKPQILIPVIKKYLGNKLKNFVTPNDILKLLITRYHLDIDFIKNMVDLGFLEYGLDLNTVVICLFIESFDLESIDYVIKKHPYLKYKTYNYLVDLYQYKNSILIKKEIKHRSGYFKKNIWKTISMLERIFEIVKKENIIFEDSPKYTKSINLLIDKDNDINREMIKIKNDIESYLFKNIKLTKENNMIEELF